MVNWRMSGVLMDVEHCHEFSGTTLTFDANTGACGPDFDWCLWTRLCNPPPLFMNVIFFDPLIEIYFLYKILNLNRERVEGLTSLQVYIYTISSRKNTRTPSSTL